MKSISKEDRAERRTNLEAAAGMLLICGALMHEWGLPINKAVKGLRLAYRMERDKQGGKRHGKKLA